MVVESIGPTLNIFDRDSLQNIFAKISNVTVQMGYTYASVKTASIQKWR